MYVYIYIYIFIDIMIFTYDHFFSSAAANRLDQDSCGFFLVCPKGGEALGFEAMEAMEDALNWVNL